MSSINHWKKQTAWPGFLILFVSLPKRKLSLSSKLCMCIYHYVGQLFAYKCFQSSDSIIDRKIGQKFMSRRKNRHNICEGVVGDGEHRMLLRIQKEEKESLPVSCFRGQTAELECEGDSEKLAQSWRPDITGCQKLAGRAASPKLESQKA